MSPAPRSIRLGCSLTLLSMSLVLYSTDAAPPREEPLLPDPPMQKAAWTPPKHKLSEKLVKAATALFEQGMADPRGCEYRTIKIITGSCRTDWVNCGTTHAWVLPTKPGDERRFAVCWNGLLYPVVSIGDKADLANDVRDYIQAHNPDDPAPSSFPSPSTGEGTYFREIDELAVCLLLRKGEGDLATKLWDHFQKIEEADRRGREAQEEETDSYAGLALRWVRLMFDRITNARLRGDDALALYDSRRLTVLSKPVLQEAKNRSPKLVDAVLTHLDFLEKLPIVLADQERRAKKGERPPTVCLGPGRISDQSKRIAALIDRLDELTGDQDLMVLLLHRSPLPGDPVVKALIREGDAAIEPLLECLRNDNRLTRLIQDEFAHTGLPTGTINVVPVHEAAYVALYSILQERNIEPAKSNEDPAAKRKALVDAVQRYKEKKKEVPHQEKKKEIPDAEQWFRVLADDSAGGAKWTQAADALFKRELRTSGLSGATWDARRQQSEPPRESRPALVGEPLRSKKEPTVSQLLLKRIEQSNFQQTARSLADRLTEWDPAAARPVLVALARQSKKAAEWKEYLELTQARFGTGDRGALDDYLDWVITTEPQSLKEISHESVFRLMWEQSNHPGMADAAERLFGRQDSPWVKADPHLLAMLPMSKFPAFRRLVLAKLADKAKKGRIVARRKNGEIFIDWLNGEQSMIEGENANPSSPREGIGELFRHCDEFAQYLGNQIDAAPRCELYWPQQKRDVAIADSIEFLKRYGSRISNDGRSLVFPELIRPATVEEVRLGRAIFSLAGEGETRTVRLPSFPVEARWTTLKDHPYWDWFWPDETGDMRFMELYHQSGRVWQAEEVKQDGKWKRYYGFVGSHRVARVPAEEIEFPAKDGGFPVKGGGWVSLPAGFDGRLEVPPLPIEPDWDGDPRFAADTSLLFTLALRNRTGLDKQVRALAPRTRLRLWHSPETASLQGALVAVARREEERTELPLKPTLKFEGVAEQPLGPAAEVKTCVIDLRDCFDLGKPGFYRLRLASDDKDAQKGREHFTDVRFSLASDTSREPR